MKALTMMKPQSHGGRRNSRDVIRLDCNEILSHVKSCALLGQSPTVFAGFRSVLPLPDYGLLGCVQHLSFLVLPVFWLSIVFASFGLFAPANPTTIVILFLCSLAVSGGIVLIEELDNPQSGLIQISSDSMRKALIEITH